MSSQVGTLLNGRYRLDAQIGAGGMSTVYKAFDVNLERRVAIKLLHREMSADSDQLSASGARRGRSRSSRTRTSSA